MKNANKKQLALILNPLDRIARATEVIQDEIIEANVVLSVNLKAAAKETYKELQKHTSLLTEIRDLLRKGNTEGGGGGKLKMPRISGAAKGAFAIVVMAGALVAASGILSNMGTISPAQFATALAIGVLFTVLTPIFIAIVEVFYRSTGRIIVDKLTGGGGKKGGISGMLTHVGGAVLSMLGMAIAITASSYILGSMGSVSAGQFATAFAIAVVMIPLSLAIGGFIVGMRRAGIKMDKKSLGMLALLPVAMTLAALGLAGVAHIFDLAMPDKFSKLPPLLWTISVSLMLFAFSFAFTSILKGMKGRKLWEIALAGLAIPIVALAIVGAAHIMQWLPDKADFKYIPLLWALNTGIAITLFAIPFMLIATLTKASKLGFKEMGMGMLAVAASGISLLSTAWIFSVLPDDFKAPPIDWAVNAAISITLFSIPLILLGLVAASGAGAAAILLGAVGVILVAGVIWAVAWIFSKLPTVDISAIDALSRGLMSPMHAMIDVFKRFKDEIGIENMMGLAGGLVMLAGAWLTLVAATAGQAVGGVLSSIGNLGSALIDGFASLFGADKPETPISILDKLLARGKKIGIIAEPIKKIGEAFLKITGTSADIIKSMSAIEPITDEYTSAILDNNAASFGKIATAYEKISVASNSINVKGINASTKMFNALARLAEADGEDAMTVMAEKLMEAVRELSDVVENLEGVMSKNGTQNKNLFEKLGSKFEEVVKGSTETVKEIATSKNNVNVDMGPVIKAINLLEERLDLPLTVNIDDSI
jgi:hypothetical protein